MKMFLALAIFGLSLSANASINCYDKATGATLATNFQGGGFVMTRLMANGNRLATLLNPKQATVASFETEAGVTTETLVGIASTTLSSQAKEKFVMKKSTNNTASVILSSGGVQNSEHQFACDPDVDNR